MCIFYGQVSYGRFTNMADFIQNLEAEDVFDRNIYTKEVLLNVCVAIEKIFSNVLRNSFPAMMHNIRKLESIIAKLLQGADHVSTGFVDGGLSTCSYLKEKGFKSKSYTINKNKLRYRNSVAFELLDLYKVNHRKNTSSYISGIFHSLDASLARIIIKNFYIAEGF